MHSHHFITCFLLLLCVVTEYGVVFMGVTFFLVFATDKRALPNMAELRNILVERSIMICERNGL